MRPSAHGRPGTEVIPTQWSADHRPVAEGTMTGALCSISAPAATGALNRTTLQHATTSGTLLYTGKCRIQRLDAQRQQVAAQPVNTVDYLVVLPFSANVIEVGSVLTITQAAGDPDLLNERMTVESVAKGSHIWERDLFCKSVVNPPH